MEKLNFKNNETKLNKTTMDTFQDNIENAITEVNNKFNYSTEEQIIGKWLDGKTLYRKCLQLTSPNTVDTNTNIYTITENIDTLVDIRGIIYNQGSSHKGSINSYITSNDNISTWRTL